MHPLTYSVDLKLARSQQICHQLAASVSSWALNNRIEVKVELLERQCGVRLKCGEFSVPPALGEWQILFSECVHHLRSSLDNLAFALARLENDPPEQPTAIAFPIHEHEASYLKEAPRRLNQLHKEVELLIGKVQPFHRLVTDDDASPKKDPLFVLHSLSNLDKHQVPSVVLIAPQEIRYSQSIEFETDEGAAASDPGKMAFHVGPIEKNAILLEWITSHPIARVTGKMDFAATVSIEFAGNYTSILELLQALHVYTCLIVDQFRHFFDR